MSNDLILALDKVLPISSVRKIHWLLSSFPLSFSQLGTTPKNFHERPDKYL